MIGRLNDLLRALIRLAIIAGGWGLELIHRRRKARFANQQARLVRRYQITSDTPIVGYGPQTETAISATAKRTRSVSFAMTSGSTEAPKRIPYSPARLRMVKLTYIDAFARCFAKLPISRTSLYVFGALSADDSLTGLLLDEPKLPPYLSSLQAPYRVQHHPSLQKLAADYGAAAMRLWVLTISNPGVLYATNPSTISKFLDDLESDWEDTTQLIRDYVRRRGMFDNWVHAIARRIDSRGSKDRLQRIASSETPLPIAQINPALEAYMCWDGGYVRPFLDRIEARLPPERYRRIPMYSMSTETIETVTDISDGQVRFVPLGPGVLYEFIAEGADDTPQDILRPEQLEVGSAYAMVVSDAYGLKRYQTDDLFECEAFVDGLPALRFLRRRSLEYSFTGEKLTAEQLAAAYDALRGRFDDLQGEVFLTCVPSQPPSASVPHYKLVVIGDASTEDAVLAAAFDRSLTGINEEYAAKRNSGRLAAPQVVRTSVQTLVKRVGSDRQVDSWESQFKLLPLYRRTWESRDV